MVFGSSRCVLAALRNLREAVRVGSAAAGYGRALYVPESTGYRERTRRPIGPPGAGEARGRRRDRYEK